MVPSISFHEILINSKKKVPGHYARCFRTTSRIIHDTISGYERGVCEMVTDHEDILKCQI